jgi:hypothetical protein
VPETSPAALPTREEREQRVEALRREVTSQPLQVEDPARDPRMDLLEELGDAVVYARRAVALGVPGARYIYRALVRIASFAAQRWYPSAEEAAPRG